MKNLYTLFNKFKVDGYVIPKNDEYFNEYVSPSKDRLKFISNFSGSAGFAIILKKQNFLFVDGRYSFQAKKQSGKKFKIFTIPHKLPKDIINKTKKITLGFDPKLHTERQLKFLFNIKNVKLKPLNTNLIDLIWKNKKLEKIRPFFLVPRKAIGINFEKKILQVKKIIKKNKTDILLVTSPENVAWILNIRGQDSNFSPIPNSRLLVNSDGKIILFANVKKIKMIKKTFKNKVLFVSENNLDQTLRKIKNKIIWLDNQSCSFYYKKLLSSKNKVFQETDPIHFIKSIKNSNEIKNIEKAHLYDGIALTKFLFWVKQNFKKKKITEISAQNKLEAFRKMNPNYKFPSFSTISGSGPNSAIIHYKADRDSNRELKKGDLYLVDSGGQYFYGTTDVTRTLSLENKSKSIRDIYTRVLKGHIAVSNFKIKKNTTGSEIDYNARKFLKQINLDYPHGTGHGVGYFLNVHEGLQSLSKKNKMHLKNGMVLSNEPGYYKDGCFGIRIENLVCIKRNKFKELTVAPIEKDLINRKILNSSEILWINSYHNHVKKTLYKFMSQNEKVELNKACSPI